MSKVTVYGASDDLVEIEGDLREEFNPGEEPMLLAFGDGTVLEARYDDGGVWRITRRKSGSALFEKTELEGDGEDDRGRYSDVVTLTGDLRWVLGAEKVKLHDIRPEGVRPS